MNNQNIVSYIPKRDRFGKFKSIKWNRIAWKTIKFQLIALSLIMNVWFMRQLYVVTCSAGGHFVTQAKCDELASLQQDSQELARLQVMENNPDLFK